MNNRFWNCRNTNQCDFKRVLCVCSAGLLRSPTAALVLSQKPYNFNTRAAGIDEGHALIPVDDVLLEWADEIVCMTPEQEGRLKLKLLNITIQTKPVICLDIEDNYVYRDPELINLIKEKYNEKGPKI